MGGNIVDIQLPRTYAVERLRSDLAASEALHPPMELARDYHEGGWSAIPLIAAGGRLISASSQGASRDAAPAATPAMAACPYVRTLLEELPCPKTSARFLYLKKGAEILEHCDPPMNTQSGALRLHVPVITHPDVLFVVGGKRVRWDAGELWWADFSLPHSVKNQSPIDRVHLVVDVEITAELLALFPVEARARFHEEGVVYHESAISLAEHDLRRLECDFKFPAFALPRKVPVAGIGSIRLEGGALAMVLSGKPDERFELVPYSSSHFGLCNWPPCYRLHFDLEEGRVVGLRLVVRGLPEISTFVPLGLERIKERSVVLELRKPAAL
jgi:hypothetical protein